MRREKKYKNLYIVGVVYKYTSPSGKVYIGQTTNERHRRNTWFCLKRRYAGYAIDKARKKYGPENFEYEVLFKHEFNSFEEARVVLDELESYYIKLYDSLRNGYNNTSGGLFPEYEMRSVVKGREINRKRGELSPSQIRRFSPKRTKEESNKMRKETNRRNVRWKKVYQFDLDGNFIREFSSASEAEELGLGCYPDIIRSCRILGKHKGYNWRFASDGKIMRRKERYVRPPEFYDYNRNGVIKFDKDGNYIAEYNSITDAALSCGKTYTSMISACLNGREKYAHGFSWKYKNAV